MTVHGASVLRPVRPTAERVLSTLLLGFVGVLGCRGATPGEAARAPSVLPDSTPSAAVPARVGTGGVPVVLRRTGPGRWLGDHPAWPISVRPLSAGALPDVGVVLGDLRKDGAGNDVIPLTTILWGAPIGASALQLADDPGSFALQSARGVLVHQTGRPSRTLDVGTPILSASGRLLAVVTTSHATIYDTATWDVRASVDVRSAGYAAFTDADDFLLLTAPLSAGAAAVVDIARGTVWMTDRDAALSFGSPSKRFVATLDEKGGEWSVSFHHLGDADAPHRTPIQFDRINSLLFDIAEDALVLYQCMPQDDGCQYRAVTRFSLQGVELPFAAGFHPPHPPWDGARVEPGLGVVLPKGVYFGASRGSSERDGPTAEGLYATYTSRCTTPACTSAEQALAVFDVNAPSLLQHVPLLVKDGFTTQTVRLVDGGRFAFACGRTSFGPAAFIVDVRGGRSTLLARLDDCGSVDGNGAHLMAGDGVRDLGADMSDGAWPPITRVNAAPSDLDTSTELAIPREGPGRYCLFGDTLEPLDACDPSP